MNTDEFYASQVERCDRHVVRLNTEWEIHLEHVLVFGDVGYEAYLEHTETLMNFIQETKQERERWQRKLDEENGRQFKSHSV